MAGSYNFPSSALNNPCFIARGKLIGSLTACGPMSTIIPLSTASLKSILVLVDGSVRVLLRGLTIPWAMASSKKSMSLCPGNLTSVNLGSISPDLMASSKVILVSVSGSVTIPVWTLYNPSLKASIRLIALIGSFASITNPLSIASLMCIGIPVVVSMTFPLLPSTKPRSIASSKFIILPVLVSCIFNASGEIMPWSRASAKLYCLPVVGSTTSPVSGLIKPGLSDLSLAEDEGVCSLSFPGPSITIPSSRAASRLTVAPVLGSNT